MEALRNMPLPELRQLLAEFPWFASGHIELVRRVAHIDSGVMSELEKAALNVWSRAALYDIARKNSGEMDFTDADAPAAEETVPEPSPRIVVLGGDYRKRLPPNLTILTNLLTTCGFILKLWLQFTPNRDILTRQKKFIAN